ncbi:MAG: 6-carboxytetrahydropterin synthase [Bryobacterales bacterium]|nr:6-carboxytetrahydropterin synthase [Bryobacterales bacterium]
MIRVTRRYRFSASHRLHAEVLSDEENRALYGKCNNPFGHGHNYVLEISVRGPVDPVTGRAVNLEALDSLVHRWAVEAFDRRNLNTEISEFRGIVPTTENLGREIYRRLNANWQSAFPAGQPTLEKVRIAETERNIFEIQ